jgi:ubiquinone/menaquinone biosynthesis C-methylase UbiE
MNNYNVETAEYIKHGLNLFQCWLLGDTEAEHVELFCRLTQPKGLVIDMGCGIGSMGELMQDRCPSISKVINVTNAEEQVKILELRGLNYVHADFSGVPLESGIADFVMFNESFGYGNPKDLMEESARLLKVGGALVIKDFSLGNNLTKHRYLSGWDCSIQPTSTVIKEAESNNLKLVSFIHPEANIERWDDFMQKSSMLDWHGDEASEAQACMYHFVKL